MASARRSSRKERRYYLQLHFQQSQTFLEMLRSVDIVSVATLRRSEGQHDIQIRAFLLFKGHVRRMASITELPPV